MRQSLMSKAATLAAGIAVSTTTISVVMMPDAQAATITRTVNGVSWDISTFRGTWNNISPVGWDTFSTAQLPMQEWFGDRAKANAFAAAVGFDLGVVNAIGAGTVASGPMFVTSFDAGNFFGVKGSLFTPGLGLPGGVVDNWTGDPSYTFATAVRTPTTAVPTPALLPALMGFGVSIWRKRKDERRPVEA
jgi:hypothetical protein